MNWNKVKTVMIWILIAANVILAHTLFMRYRNMNYISEEALDSVCGLLAEAGVTIDASVISRRKPDLYVYESERTDTYQTQTAELLSGSAVVRRFMTPAESEVTSEITMENGDIYRFGRGFSFSYLHAGEDGAELEAALNSYHTAGTDVLKTTADARENAIIKLVTTFLLASAKADEEASNETASVGFAEVTVRFDAEQRWYLVSGVQSIDGVPLFGNSIQCIVREGSITPSMITGTWCFLFSQRRYSSPLYDQLNILFSEKKRAENLRLQLEYDELEGGMTSTFPQLLEVPLQETAAVNNIVPAIEFELPPEPEASPEMETTMPEGTAAADIETAEAETDSADTPSSPEESEGTQNTPEGEAPTDEGADVKITITSLQLCYCVYQSSDGTHIFFIPGWKIIRADDSVTVYNAIDGNIYTNIEH